MRGHRTHFHLFHHRIGKHKAAAIAKVLRHEGLIACGLGVAEFLKHFKSMGTICCSGRPSKVTAKVKRVVEEQMRLDDETTATQLHLLLNNRSYPVLLWIILRCQTSLGWTFRGSS